VCVCVCCVLRQYRASAQRLFLSFCFNTPSVNGHKNIISVTQHVFYFWPTSELKFCTLILGHLEKRILCNTNSRQKKKSTIMLAVGAALPVVCTRWRTDSLLVRWFLGSNGTTLAGQISELPWWHLVLPSTVLPAVVAVNMNDTATTLNTL